MKKTLLIGLISSILTACGGGSGSSPGGGDTDPNTLLAFDLSGADSVVVTKSSDGGLYKQANGEIIGKIVKSAIEHRFRTVDIDRNGEYMYASITSDAFDESLPLISKLKCSIFKINLSNDEWECVHQYMASDWIHGSNMYEGRNIYSDSEGNIYFVGWDVKYDGSDDFTNPDRSQIEAGKLYKVDAETKERTIVFTPEGDEHIENFVVHQDDSIWVNTRKQNYVINGSSIENVDTPDGEKHRVADFNKVLFADYDWESKAYKLTATGIQNEELLQSTLSVPYKLENESYLAVEHVLASEEGELFIISSTHVQQILPFDASKKVISADFLHNPDFLQPGECNDDPEDPCRYYTDNRYIGDGFVFSLVPVPTDNVVSISGSYTFLAIQSLDGSSTVVHWDDFAQDQYELSGLKRDGDILYIDGFDWSELKPITFKLDVAKMVAGETEYITVQGTSGRDILDRKPLRNRLSQQVELDTVSVTHGYDANNEQHVSWLEFSDAMNKESANNALQMTSNAGVEPVPFWLSNRAFVITDLDLNNWQSNGLSDGEVVSLSVDGALSTSGKVVADSEVSWTVEY